MWKLKICVLIFIWMIWGCSGVKVKNTTVLVGDFREVTFKEPYAVRYDSIFDRSKVHNGTYIIVVERDTLKYVTIERYRKGRLSGTRYEYNRKGQLTFCGPYKRGLERGWHYKFLDGKLLLATRYKRGKRVESYGLP